MASRDKRRRDAEWNCESEFSNVQSLDIQTCETFRCIECREIFKHIKDVKEHVTNVHEGKNITFEHTKCDRNCPDYFDGKL